MKKMTLLAAALAASFSFAQAAEHEVKMLNKGDKGAMVFEPDFVKAEVGDTVRFVPVDKSHNVVGKEGYLPEGAIPFKSKVNEEYVLTVDHEGVYSLFCQPHYAMGMVMVVQAGAAVNLDAAKAAKHPGKAKKVFAELLDTIAQ